MATSGAGRSSVGAVAAGAVITARLHLADVAGGMREADRLVRARIREIAGART